MIANSREVLTCYRKIRRAWPRPRDPIRAAQNGYIDAMVNLGVMYEKGAGVAYAQKLLYQVDRIKYMRYRDAQ